MDVGRADMTTIDGFILDDNLELREVTAEFLQLYGIHVEQVASIADGQRLLNELTQLRYAVCDLRLPDGSAVEFVCRVCERFPSARVVAVSGYCDRADVARIQQKGAIYINKPVDLDLLKDVLTGS